MSTLRIPAEWEPHEGVYLAMPYLHTEWHDLRAAQRDVSALASALAAAGESVTLLVQDAKVAATARRLLDQAASAVSTVRADSLVRTDTDTDTDTDTNTPTGHIELFTMRYGDAWLRDTAPVFATCGTERAALVFEFDGWGGKFDMPGDKTVGMSVAAHRGRAALQRGYVFEGGALEVDGRGAAMVSRCMIDRNPEWDQSTADRVLRKTLGLEQIHWIDGSLENDHTDGHIDTLARFVRPGHALCAQSTADDPNHETHESVAAALDGAGLEVSRIPSPGALHLPSGDDGATLVPASYCNFFVANDAVLVPAYGVDNDEPARRRLEDLLDRRAVSVSARGVIAGGGALHCLTQQVPR